MHINTYRYILPFFMCSSSTQILNEDMVSQKKYVLMETVILTRIFVPLLYFLILNMTKYFGVPILLLKCCTVYHSSIDRYFNSLIRRISVPLTLREWRTSIPHFIPPTLTQSVMSEYADNFREWLELHVTRKYRYDLRKLSLKIHKIIKKKRRKKYIKLLKR